jgi:hypothetical protein
MGFCVVEFFCMFCFSRTFCAQLVATRYCHWGNLISGAWGPLLPLVPVSQFWGAQQSGSTELMDTLLCTWCSNHKWQGNVWTYECWKLKEKSCLACENLILTWSNLEFGRLKGSWKICCEDVY